ncbi:MAG: hypothetical protein R2880_19160 [Deinococcales bacterium]
MRRIRLLVLIWGMCCFLGPWLSLAQAFEPAVIYREEMLKSRERRAEFADLKSMMDVPSLTDKPFYLKGPVALLEEWRGPVQAVFGHWQVDINQLELRSRATFDPEGYLVSLEDFVTLQNTAKKNETTPLQLYQKTFEACYEILITQLNPLYQQLSWAGGQQQIQNFRLENCYQLPDQKLSEGNGQNGGQGLILYQRQYSERGELLQQKSYEIIDSMWVTYIEHIWYGDKHERLKERYNSYGHLLESWRYDLKKLDDPDDDLILSHQLYSYDELGRRQSAASYVDKDLKTLKSCIIYSYDAWDNLQEEYHRSFKEVAGNTICQPDHLIPQDYVLQAERYRYSYQWMYQEGDPDPIAWRKDEISRYDGAGALLERHIYRYDDPTTNSSSSLIPRSFMQNILNLVSDPTSSNLDTGLNSESQTTQTTNLQQIYHNRLLSLTSYDSAGKAYQHILYDYDAKGHLIREVKERLEPQKTQIFEHTWNYDEQGNLREEGYEDAYERRLERYDENQRLIELSHHSFKRQLFVLGGWVLERHEQYSYNNYGDKNYQRIEENGDVTEDYYSYLYYRPDQASGLDEKIVNWIQKEERKKVDKFDLDYSEPHHAVLRNICYYQTSPGLRCHLSVDVTMNGGLE